MLNSGNTLKIDRHKSVLDAVSKKRRISLSELETMLNVSRITIQRDLVELEKRKLLVRFHGGAMSIDHSEDLYDTRLRKEINTDIKKMMAKKAASLIKPKCYIGLDASSTVYYLSEEILPSDIFTLTSGMETFSSLVTHEGITAVLTGGRLNTETRTLVGPEAVESVKKFHFDLVFISAEAFVSGAGFFDPYADEVEVKRALIKSAKKIVMLIDSSKLKDRGGIKICGVGDIDYLITDEPAHKKFKKDFKGRML